MTDDNQTHIPEHFKWSYLSNQSPDPPPGDSVVGFLGLVDRMANLHLDQIQDGG